MKTTNVFSTPVSVNILKLFIPLIISVNSFGQNTVEGRVSDESGVPLEFVNVVLVKPADSSLIKATITNSSGEFTLKIPDGNKYKLLISQVGYRKFYTDTFSFAPENTPKKLADITLSKDDALLKEVEAVYKRPFIEHYPDKTVVNVENSIVSTGGSVMDVLKRSPGVMVDKDGSISLEGRSGVLVLINGKPTYMSAEQLNGFLNGMSSDQVGQLELMSNPPAKYDASGTGGVINIKLKKSKLYGFNSTLNSSYKQGFYTKTNDGITFNYRNEYFNVFGNYYYTYDHNFYNGVILGKISNADHLAYSTLNKFNLISKDNSQNFKTGLDFYANKKQTLGFIFTGTNDISQLPMSNLTEIRNSDDQLESSSSTQSYAAKNWKTFSGNLNYKWDIDTSGSSFTADADYAHFNFGSDQQFTASNYDSTEIMIGTPYKLRNSAPVDITILSAKSDLIKQINKTTKFEAGIKKSNVTTDNDVKYFKIHDNTEALDTMQSNHFRYNENINAAYVDISKEFEKLSVQLGMRGEQTKAAGEQLTNNFTFTRNYFQLFPTAFFGYKLNAKNAFNLSYSRRIDRPSYQDMNPFRFYIDPYTYQEGNPYLKPSVSNSLSLAHTFNNLITTSLTHVQVRDMILQVFKHDESTKTTFVINENIEKLDQYTLGFSMPISITKWWSTNNNLNIMYLASQWKASGAELKTSSISFQYNNVNEFDLKKGFSAELQARYSSPFSYGLWVVNPRYSVSTGVQKKLLKDRAKLKLSFINIIYNATDHVIAKEQNLSLDLKRKQDNRTITLSFVYNFGKSTVKNSTTHTSSAEDEMNRAGKKN